MDITPRELPPPPVGRVGWPWSAPANPGAWDGRQGPRITLVTPSLNQAPYLEQTIRSVLLQGYSNLEYFILDGGSTDGSVDIIRRYEPWLAGWSSAPDRGQAAAINSGWSRGTGELFGWLNSDDLLAPGALQAVADCSTRHPTGGMLYGNLRMIDAAGTRIGEETYNTFDFADLIADVRWLSQPGSFVHGRVLDAIGMLDEQLQFMMDFDLCLRAALATEIVHVPAELAWFRRHELSKTASQSATAAREIIHVYDRFFARPDLPPFVRTVERRAKANARLYASRAWHFAGRSATAWKLALSGWALSPATLFDRQSAILGFQLLAGAFLGGRHSRAFHFVRRLAGTS